MAPNSSNRPSRPHVCRVCRKAFVRAEHLRRHIASHENLRHFLCQRCGASFTRADVLHRHVKKCGEKSRVSPVSQQGDVIQQSADIEDATEQSMLRNHTVGMASDLDPGQAIIGSLPHEQSQEHTSFASSESPNRTHCSAEGELGRYDTSRQASHQGSQGQVTQTAQIPQSSANNPLNNQGQGVIPFSAQDPGPSELLTFSSTMLNGSTDLVSADLATRQPSLMTGPSNIFEDMPSLVLEDFSFLEDSLLPEFDFNPQRLDSRRIFGETRPQRPQQPQQGQGQQQALLDTEEILSSRTRHVTPVPSQIDSLGGTFGNRATFWPYRGLKCTQEDVETVIESIASVCEPNDQGRITFLSRSRLTRFLNAYFEYFDSHTPIVHHPSFSVSTTHPGLILAMLAIGGSYLSEHKAAQRSYELSCHLIAQYESQSFQNPDFALWPIQAALLCAQYGAFTDNVHSFRKAQRQIALVSDLLALAEKERFSCPTVLTSDWAKWILSETLSRLTCWTWVLDAVIACYEPTATCQFVRQETSKLSLPSSDSLWRASSSMEWAAIRETESQSSICINTAVKMIFRAQSPPEPIFSFGLMALLGSILSSICMTERSNIFTSGMVETGSISRLEQALHAWEILWRRHPHAETVPSRHGDSLMVDSLALLGSAYYHLYLGPELRHIKQTAASPEMRLSWLQYRAHSRVLRAVKYAASSWLVRAKLGVTHLKRVAALMFGGHTLVTGYETALILSWWLSIRKDAEYQLMTQGENVACLQRLDDLFQEIYDEIEDQGICSDIPQIESGRRPLAFYRMLMHRWVWTYSATMEKNLHSLELRLATETS